MSVAEAVLARPAPTLRNPLVRMRAEATLLVAGLLGFVVFPDDLGMLTNILATAIFALSLSLVLGQAGILSMGHAALFGSGAYAAGWAALHVSHDPVIGLLLGGVGGAVVALLSGAVLLRSTKLTLVMLTISTAQLLLELGNWARGLTGGDDGLTGFTIGPLLGMWDFDFLGHVGYFYALAVLVVVYFGLRCLVESPFGLTARAIRLDAGRVEALGGRVYLHLVCVYVVGGFVAGLAGALTAQTSKVASLSMLDFQASAGVLIMVMLGGSRRLSGAVLGTVAYMSIQHVASTLNPYHWLFLIGAMLITVLLVLPNGLVDLVDRASAVLRRLWTRAATRGDKR
jgi:branched-chain amino acid transport system permease protein